MLILEHTIRSYSGKPGCMCGCMGTYKESSRARKMAITQLTKDPAARVQVFQEGDGCLFVRTSTRNRVLYLTQEGVAAAQNMGIAAV